MKKQLVSTCVLLFLSVCFPSKTLAQGYINWPETWQQWYELQNLNQQWWNSLSPRAQYLVKAVDTVEQVYTKQTGNVCIPITQQTLGEMMYYIGAVPNEAEFVLGRMQKSCQVGNTIRQADDVINDIERQMQCGFRPECYR